jgi:hypothetical protein
MKSRKFTRSPIVALVSVLLLASCSGPDLVIVDSAGKPVADAKVVGASLSMAGQATLSDRKGRARIPWSVQATKWVSVYKDGFNPVENIDIAQKKPIVVKMTRKDK